MNDTKLSLIKSLKLQSQFKSNYKHKVKDFLKTISEEDYRKLLDLEFNNDKHYFSYAYDCFAPSARLKSKFNILYVYVPTYDQLTAKSGERTHVNHCLHRTISAYLLEDCTIEEKAIILSKFSYSKYYTNKAILQIAYGRLKNLDELINSYQL